MAQVGKILAVCTSPKKGMRKTNIGRGLLAVEHGLEGDAHAGKWHRQVSLLAMESIQKMIEKGLTVGPGDFAENLTTEGLDLPALPIGTQVRVLHQALPGALLEVTQIGKVCHSHCAIYELAGDCVMPREGIFVRVLRGGEVEVGDSLEILEPDAAATAGS